MTRVVCEILRLLVMGNVAPLGVLFGFSILPWRELYPSLWLAIVEASTLFF